MPRHRQKGKMLERKIQQRKAYARRIYLRFRESRREIRFWWSRSSSSGLRATISRLWKPEAIRGFLESRHRICTETRGVRIIWDGKRRRLRLKWNQLGLGKGKRESPSEFDLGSKEGNLVIDSGAGHVLGKWRVGVFSNWCGLNRVPCSWRQKARLSWDFFLSRPFGWWKYVVLQYLLLKKIDFTLRFCSSTLYFFVFVHVKL